jgi:hypothetical protein
MSAELRYTNFGRGFKTLVERSGATSAQAHEKITDEHLAEYLLRMLTDTNAVYAVHNESWQRDLVRMAANLLVCCVFENRPSLVYGRTEDEVLEATINFLNKKIDRDLSQAA